MLDLVTIFERVLDAEYQTIGSPGIIRDLLLPVKLNHPEISFADIYAVAGQRL